MAFMAVSLKIASATDCSIALYIDQHIAPANAASSRRQLSQSARPSHSRARFLSVADQLTKSPKFAVCRGARTALDRTVEFDHLLADRGKGSASAAGPSGRGGDRRLGQAFVDLLDEKPGSPIRHTKIPRCGGDRSLDAYRLQECDLAGADAVAVGEVQTDGYANVRHCRPRVLRGRHNDYHKDGKMPERRTRLGPPQRATWPRWADAQWPDQPGEPMERLRLRRRCGRQRS